VGADSSTGGYGRRRGFGRAAALLASLMLVVSGGCGDSGRGAETDPEKGSDAAILNEALARELTLAEAYVRGRLTIRDAESAVWRRLRAQQLEYVNALTKAIRGLGGDIEAEAEELDPVRAGGAIESLTLAYELESAALAFYVEQAARLYTPAPRTLDASLAAGHGQHLVVLRQALGESPAGSIPEAFDGGEVTAPLAGRPGGGG
jgi:Ferritin-like domain